MSMDDERRSQQRRHLAFFTRLFDRQTGSLLGYLANVTTEGAMLICDTPLEVGKVYRLYMDLSEAFLPRQHIDFEGECIWSRSDEIDPGSFNAGFRFYNLPPEDSTIIEQIVTQYGIHS